MLPPFLHASGSGAVPEGGSSGTVVSMKRWGGWIGDKVSNLTSFTSSSSSTDPPAAPPRPGMTGIGLSASPLQDSAYGVPLPNHLLAQRWQEYAPPTPPPSYSLFEIGDEVVVTEAAGSGEDDWKAIPVFSEVAVVEPPEEGKVKVRWGDEAGWVSCRRMRHPVLILRVSDAAVKGVDVHLSPSVVSPVLRRLLPGDFLELIRYREPWFQSTDGGWTVVSEAMVVPVILPGSMIKTVETVCFDNGRRVNRGCIGTVTQVPGDQEGSVAEVTADGVVWDAADGHFSLLIPQSSCKLSLGDVFGSGNLDEEEQRQPSPDPSVDEAEQSEADDDDVEDFDDDASLS